MYRRLWALLVVGACGKQPPPPDTTQLPRPPAAAAEQAPTVGERMAADSAHAARDRQLGLQVRVATDSADSWRSNEPSWVTRQYQKLRVIADSLTRTKADTQAPPPQPEPPPQPTNQPPVARFTGPTSCVVGKPCVFDGSLSTDDKGVAGYTWDCAVVPQCTASGASATATYPHAPDQRTVRLTVRDAEGLTNTMTRTVNVVADTAVTPPPQPEPPPQPLPPDTTLKIVPPALPTRVPDFQPKPCSRHVDVLSGANLQAAINAAAAGDCLDLAPGARWQGNFRLPTRTCSSATQWITITTKGAQDIPGMRMTPAVAQAGRYAQLVSASNQFALGTTDPTECWQIQHLEIVRDPAYTGLSYHLFVIGFSASDGNTSLATNPSKIIVRRNWIHGQPTTDLVRCIAVNGRDIAIVDNWIDDCHAGGFDSQAVEGWNGAGPILIENNFLAGAGENVMFGGAGPANSTLRPCDITMRRNHVYKDPAWKGVWSIKNIFELKNACRLLVDANVFENSWPASQIGHAIVIKSSTGGASDTVRQGSTDLTFTNNRVMNSALGFNVQAKDCTAQACILYPVARVVVQNNLLTGIGTSNGIVGSGWLMPTYGGPQDVLYRNNTFVGNTPGKGISIYMSGGAQAEWNSIRWNRNILAGQTDYAIGADCAQPTHMPALDCIIGAGKWTFSENVVSGVLQTYWSKNPPNNTYKVTQAEIGLTSDFRAPNFPGVGVDVPALNAKIAGVVVPPATLARRAKAPPGQVRRVRYTAADSAFCRANACTP